MMQQKIRPSYSLLFLVIIYTVGVIGLWSPYGLLFRQLTPLNLVLTAAILLYYHRSWNNNFLLFLLSVFAAGYAVEWIGVHTGLIFGSYAYGSTLGFRLDGVPLIIGLNWFILVYSIGTIMASYQWNRLLQATAGAALMVCTDVFLEIVAVEFGFWTWERQAVPFENYLGWFVVSLAFFLLFFYLKFNKNNKVAPGIFVIQFLFFITNAVIIIAS